MTAAIGTHPGADFTDEDLAIRNGDPLPDPDARGTLEFRSLASIAQAVRDAPPPGWLIQEIWPCDAYGVLGAEDKAGKSWAALDMAVAVAAGGRFLGHWQVEEPGEVLMFFGEGSERKAVRRLHAIGAHHGLTQQETEDLPIRLCMRAPRLDSDAHLATIYDELERHPPKLVILDPLYLALGDTETSNLARMGQVLGNIQRAAQHVGAALLVVHHWNQTGSGTDRKRFSGAGLAEWGRILVSMSVLSRSVADPDGERRSIVDFKLEFLGDDIAEIESTFRREIWTDDFADIGAPMHYRVERTILDPAQRAAATGNEWDAAQAAKAALLALWGDDPDLAVRSKRELHTVVRQAGHEFADRAVVNAADDLVASGFLVSEKGSRGAMSYRRASVPLELAS